MNNNIPNRNFNNNNKNPIVYKKSELENIEINHINTLNTRNQKNFNMGQEINTNNQLLNMKSNMKEIKPFKHQINRSIKVDKFIRDNENEIKKINNAIFSRIGKIKVKLADLDENVSMELYNKKTKILPRIDIIQVILLNQNVSVGDLKEYGFIIYTFFLYLINLLITFFILLIFTFYYLYCIFFKYYKENEDEIFSLLEDYNLLSIVSGVQIIKFRKNYIDLYGKEDFLEQYKNFDVFYKEYIFSGVIPLIFAFLVNLFFIFYLRRVYKSYKIDHPEIKNYSLILSGKNEENPILENLQINENKVKQDILNKLEIENAEIVFTYKLSKYYEQIEEYNELKDKKYELRNKINKKEKICYFKYCFSCFYESCKCCYKQKEEELNAEMKALEDDMNFIKAYNDLYIITFKNKSDYEKAYNKYPHSYIFNCIKNLCRKEKNYFYINRAPNPEEVVWQNLDYDKEYQYFKHIGKNVLIFLIFSILSFGMYVVIELIANEISDKLLVVQIIVNVISIYIQEILDEWFSEIIDESLLKNSSFWSYSDIKYYSTLIKSIFKFFNIGIFPFFICIMNQKWLCDDEDEDDMYIDLVERMFVIIEMDGFGYPLIDSIFSQGAREKWEKWKELTENMMSKENINKELMEQNENEEGKNKLELREEFEKEDFELEENFSDVLAIYWITMFYLPIYPIGVIQTFLNLLFKYFIEFNFLLKSYKRPEYLNPNIGFFCFNSFSIGFFLLLLGNLIFFRNEDNKDSFGTAYITFMILVLIIPFSYIAKLILIMSKYCCLKKKETKNYKDIENKIKIDYKLMNLCGQTNGLKEIFFEYKEKGLLMQSQYDEILNKLDELKDMDLYKLQKSFRTQKEIYFEEREIKDIKELQKDISINSIQDEKKPDLSQNDNNDNNDKNSSEENISYDSKIFEEDNLKMNKDKKKLYYLLMQLNFLSFLETGQYSDNKEKPIKYETLINKNYLRAISLKNSFLKENLTNCDSSFFTTFLQKDKLLLAYVENFTNIKLYNIFGRKLMANVKGLNYQKKIVQLTFFKADNTPYLASISLDNEMIISDLNANDKNKSIYISDIGDTYSKNKDNINNIFYVSSVKHGKGVWIITSYYYDGAFKIYDFENLKKYRNNIDKLCFYLCSFLV